MKEALIGEIETHHPVLPPLPTGMLTVICKSCKQRTYVFAVRRSRNDYCQTCSKPKNNWNT